jgi:SAM-dependent methyltransferase
MFDPLFSFVQRPNLWERSENLFWDDSHISSKMLEAHLNPNWEAASRKHSDIDASVNWLTTLIPACSKILDLGCGPGLYTKRLSNQGYDVTGLDFSKRSIAYAKEHDQQSEYIYQNYLELDYTESFDVISLIYCDYGALTFNERQTLLAKVFCALKPGGQFIFDVFTKKTQQCKQDTSSWSMYQDGGFWSAEPHLCLEAEYYFENNSIKASQAIIVTKDEVHNHVIWDTVFDLDTLIPEVLPFGFQVSGKYDDICGSPFTGEAETLCLVLKKS